MLLPCNNNNHNNNFLLRPHRNNFWLFGNKRAIGEYAFAVKEKSLRKMLLELEGKIKINNFFTFHVLIILPLTFQSSNYLKYVCNE